MRATQFLALSGLMLASNVVLAAELERDDVPNRCWDVCGPVVGTAHRCDGMHDNDRAEMDCICDWNQASSLVPLCEACIADYRADRNNTNRDRHYDEEHDLFDNDDDDDDDDRDDRDPHHNDAYDILRSCSFSTTSYNAAAATSALSASTTGSGSGTSATSTGSTTVSATDSNTSATSTSSSGGGSSNDDSSSTGSGTSNGNSAAADSSSTDSASGAQTTDNAAPRSSAPQAASLAAIVGLGFVAWL